MAWRLRRVGDRFRFLQWTLRGSRARRLTHRLSFRCLTLSSASVFIGRRQNGFCNFPRDPKLRCSLKQAVHAAVKLHFDDGAARGLHRNRSRKRQSHLMVVLGHEAAFVLGLAEAIGRRRRAQQPVPAVTPRCIRVFSATRAALISIAALHCGRHRQPVTLQCHVQQPGDLFAQFNRRDHFNRRRVLQQQMAQCDGRRHGRT